MKVVFDLIRWKNLLLLALTIWLMQRMIAVPILAVFGMFNVLSSLTFILLLVGIVLIAAGGYAINDYFDVKIDEINKPDTRIVGRLMDRRHAMIYHQVFTITGVLCGLAASYLVRSWSLGLIFVFIPGLLWFYSASYKRQFFVGNLIVAFNAALSLLMVAIANVAQLHRVYGDLLYQTPIARQLYMWIGGFALFAFILTLIREIIKDMEDQMGDRELECHTLPIKLGEGKTKIILFVLIALTCGLLCYVNFALIPFEHSFTSLSTRYLLFGLLFPFACLIYLLVISHFPNDYKNASTLCKFIMLIGMLYSVVFYYLQAKTFGISFFGL